MAIRRINLWGGAGCGKSATAAGLFHRLKCGEIKIEHVSEYIKEMAYEGRKPESFDQLTIFALQLRLEDTRLRHMPYIITDSPLMMQTYYAKKYNFVSWPHLIGIAEDWEEQHPSLNIFLDREGIPYQKEGRFESEAGAIANDATMLEHMYEHGIQYHNFKTVEFEAILYFIQGMLKNVGTDS